MFGRRIYKGVQIEKMKKNARSKALSILERKDQTEYQMTKALADAGYSEEDIADTVEWLKELGYINDLDYARRYLEVLIAKGRGRIRIKQEMHKRGLSGEDVMNIIDDGLSPEAERENALKIAVKLIDSLPDDIERQKLMRKLSSKLATQGYNYDVVNSVIYSVLSPDSDLD